MSETEIPRRYAFVEIMGHRSHWGEISDVEFAGAKFLRVHDVETDEVHNYGGAAIFNVHEISRAKLDAHVEQQARYKREQQEREARWAAEEEARRNARLLPAIPALPDPAPDPDADPEEFDDAAEGGDPVPPPIAESEGEWIDDDSNPPMARLHLTAAYYDQPERVYCALLLVADNTATLEEVTGWTSEQRKEAAEWALSCSFSASDNEGVIVPPRPSFIDYPF